MLARTPARPRGLIHMRPLELQLPAGETLLDRLLREGVDVAHECGGKLACTTCRVLVTSGMESLSEASEDELDLLERGGGDTAQARLACQAVSRGGAVAVQTPDASVPARVAGSSPIRITERAARFLAAQLAKHAGAVAVRLSVAPSGCSGFGYRIDPAEAVREGDREFEAHGVRIAVDPLSLPYLQGAQVDVVQEGLARRLRFDNPNATNRCGCGESFGA